jgi:Tol biopolymer transport system component
VRDDTNGVRDVFVRDRRTGTTERVSVSSAGAQANGASAGAWLSGDGRFVVFESDATDLVQGDTNGARDVFVRDRRAGTTTRVSLGRGGAQANGASSRGGRGRAITQDGRYVTFESGASNLVAGDTNGTYDVFVRDLARGVTARVSLTQGGGQADGSSGRPALSGDGRVVVFESYARNLVPRDENLLSDVFARVR